jgi:glucose-1-phosphate cytidylyltransferase
MKAFILCGGNGSRLDNEGKIKPKALIKIGDNPILIHLIKNLIKNEFREFVLCLGYKKEDIEKYFFNNYKIYLKKIVNKKYKKITIKLLKVKIIIHLVDTEKNSGTGGRIKIANQIVKNKVDFFMTYCDGLAKINIKKLICFHYKKKKLVTLTAVQPQHRYGVIKINKSIVISMNNNNPKQDIWINGGYFIINPISLKLVKKKNTYWEQEPINKLIKKKELASYIHKGFWESLDTQKDKKKLNEIWKKNKNAW